MTTKELIGLLEKCPPETLVIMASDEEGNTHSPLRDVSVMPYREDWEPTDDQTFPKGVFFYPTY